MEEGRERIEERKGRKRGKEKVRERLIHLATGIPSTGML